MVVKIKANTYFEISLHILANMYKNTKGNKQIKFRNCSILTSFCGRLFHIIFYTVSIYHVDIPIEWM